MSRWIYVDETKKAGYMLDAVSITAPGSVGREVRGLIVPGRRRLHMNHETLRHCRVIVSTLATTQIEASVYGAGRRYRTDVGSSRSLSG